MSGTDKLRQERIAEQQAELEERKHIQMRQAGLDYALKVPNLAGCEDLLAAAKAITAYLAGA